MSETTTKNPAPPPARTKRRRWIFRILTLTLAIAVLPLTEGFLRLFALGKNVNLILPIDSGQHSRGSKYTHTINGAADLAYYGRTDLAGPEIRPFQMPKPDKTFRIVVLGGSTVIGFPYPPELAFPRHIELQLNRQTPDVRVEVLNAGITSINSFAIADLTAQCLDADPDLIVVHTGHNEFYGPGGPASTAFSLSPALIRQIYWFRRWRVAQMISSVMSGKQPPPDDMMNILPKVLQIPWNGDIYRQAKVNYDLNLRKIATTCSAAGVPVLLTTVVCNLRDQSPLFAIPPPMAADKKTAWEGRISEATAFIEAEEFESALPVLKSATKAAPESATAHFRMGQCLTGLGELEAAWRSFSLARDFDGCRFRIPSEFDSIVQRISEEFEGCSCLNLAASIKASGHPAAPGYDLFLEHVHYNFDGHYLVGEIISRAIQTTYRDRPWDESKSPDLSTVHEALGFLPEDDLAAMSFAILVLQTKPFSTTLDRETHLKFLGGRIAATLDSLPEARRNIFMSLNLDHMSGDLLQTLSSMHREQENFRFLAALIRAQKRRKSWESEL